MADLYNKEVMKNFKHPKNMGEIKNADGIGKVGNPVCGDVMKVYIKVGKNKDGKRIIKDIKFQTMGCMPEGVYLNSCSIGEDLEVSKLIEGDKILTFKGEDYIVSRFCREYNGSIIELIPQKTKNPLWVTPNHKVFCIKRKDIPKTRNSGHRWLRIESNNISKNLMKKVYAKEIEEGDYLIKAYPINIKKSKLNDNLIRLLGIYLADGWVDGKYKSGISLAINKNDKYLIKEVSNVIKKIYPKSIVSLHKQNRPALEIYIGSPELAKLCEQHCGRYAKQKSLSPTILALPENKLKLFLEWYMKGDGCIKKDYRRPNSDPTYEVATVSEKLAKQLQYILARLDILVSIEKRKNDSSVINGRKIKGSDIFELRWCWNPKKKQFHLLGKGLFAIPVKKIRPYKFNGLVYDFESKSHTLLQNNWLISNCIAAIATSSMITELAKGETLEEAKKITRNDVSNSLGKLPPIKEHCSNLAADALKKAIEDYENKRKYKN